MTEKATALDPRALRFGAAVALAATAVGLLVGVAHNQLYYDANASADQNAASIFLEGLIFLGVLLGGAMGLLNAIIVQFIAIPAIVATLATLSM